MIINDDKFIWENKFRPQTVKDCILPESIKKKAEKIIKLGQMQHMLFYSGPGTGKTTLAKAICEELGLDYILINGSLEGRLIETVRNTVTKFANSMSVFGGNGIKVVIYDEFDNVDTSNKGGNIQMSIRGLMDEVADTCRFIFTGNYITKIITPIQSRTTMIDFSVPVKERPIIMKQIMDRCCYILDIEGIPYSKKVLSQFIMKTFPDFRKILNELQAYSAMGKIDEGILELTVTRYDYLIESIINKDFKGCIKWTNGNTFDASIYSLVTKELQNKMDGLKWLEVILQADQYQYRHNFAVDPDITLWAFCVQLMGII